MFVESLIFISLSIILCIFTIVYHAIGSRKTNRLLNERLKEINLERNKEQIQQQVQSFITSMLQSQSQQEYAGNVYIPPPFLINSEEEVDEKLELEQVPKKISYIKKVYKLSKNEQHVRYPALAMVVATDANYLYIFIISMDFIMDFLHEFLTNNGEKSVYKYLEKVYEHNVKLT